MGYGVLILSFDIKDKNSDHVIRSVNFTYRSFTNLLTKGGIPAGINPMMILRSGADMVISEQLDSLVEYINRRGGFRILGWVRMGRVNDQSTVDGEKQTVTSSEIHHHITQILPNCEVKSFEGMRMDIGKIYAESMNSSPPSANTPDDKSNRTNATLEAMVPGQTGTSETAAAVTPPRPLKTPETSINKKVKEVTPTLGEKTGATFSSQLEV